MIILILKTSYLQFSLEFNNMPLFLLELFLEAVDLGLRVRQLLLQVVHLVAQI